MGHVYYWIGAIVVWLAIGVGGLIVMLAIADWLWRAKPMHRMFFLAWMLRNGWFKRTKQEQLAILEMFAYDEDAK